MQTKNFSAVVYGKVFDILKGRPKGWFVEDFVGSILCHFEIIFHDFLAIEGFQDNFYQPSIHRICYSSSVVGLSRHVVQCLIWHKFILVQEHFQLGLRNGEICCCEFIRNIPAQWSVFSSFKDDGVEK